MRPDFSIACFSAAERSVFAVDVELGIVKNPESVVVFGGKVVALIFHQHVAELVPLLRSKASW